MENEQEYELKSMRGKRQRAEVIIYTQSYKIIGTVHTMPGSRILDFLNSRAEARFIAVTGANIYTLPEEHLIQTADFFVLNKNEIVMTFLKSPDSKNI
jgi:hypothetical protein